MCNYTYIYILYTRHSRRRGHTTCTVLHSPEIIYIYIVNTLDVWILWSVHPHLNTPSMVQGRRGTGLDIYLYRTCECSGLGKRKVKLEVGESAFGPQAAWLSSQVEHFFTNRADLRLRVCPPQRTCSTWKVQIMLSSSPASGSCRRSPSKSDPC